MTIPVYILRSKDGRAGFCFRRGNKHDVYIYGADLFDWKNNRGHITNLEVLDHSYWLESTHIFSITPSDISDYDRCIKDWALRIGAYSIFESLGATNKSFIEETIRFFISRGATSKSLTSPSILVHDLTYRSRSRVDSLQMNEALQWRNTMSSLNYTEAALLEYINESGYFYYHELIDREDRYYLIQGAKISSSLVTLDMEIEEIIIVPAAVVVAHTHCNTPVVATVQDTPPPSRMFGFLIIVLLFTILIVLVAMAVIILDRSSEATLIGTDPLAIVEPAEPPVVVPV